MTVKAGRPLFAVRQGHRKVAFNAPVSGRVVKTNAALGADCAALELTPYQKNWVCIIDADNPGAGGADAEDRPVRGGDVPDDIDHFREVMREISKGAPEGVLIDDALHRGEIEALDDAQSERIVQEFFAR